MDKKEFDITLAAGLIAGKVRERIDLGCEKAQAIDSVVNGQPGWSAAQKLAVTKALRQTLGLPTATILEHKPRPKADEGNEFEGMTEAQARQALANADW